MFNRKIGLILLLLSFFIIIGSVSAAENMTNNASASIGDNAVDVGCIDQKNVVELNSTDVQTNNHNLSDSGKLVSPCNNGDNKDKNTNRPISSADDLENALNNGGNYVITKNITISDMSKSEGKNVYIDGNGYTIRGDDEKYCDIDVENNCAYFMNCVFYKIRIDASSDVYLYNCTFKDLRAGKYRDGAAVTAEKCKVIMGNCSVINCGSHEGYHGAVYLKDAYANITNSYFENCFGANSWSNDDEGGAIFSKSTNLDLSNCIFKNCHARDDGGAIHILKGSAAIFNCSFIGCHADASSYGGAIYVEGPTSIINCNFVDCYATKCKLSFWKGVIDGDNFDIDFKVFNCSINSIKTTSSCSISSADDLENALNFGGDYILTKNITIGDISKSYNCDVCINGNGYTIRGDDSEYCDINVEKNCVCFMNCVFDKIRIDASSDVSLYNCTIKNTLAGFCRDAAAITADGCNLIVCNCSVVDCGSNKGYYGAVYLKDCRANITNSCFDGCFASDSASCDYGGAIASEDTTLDLSNCIFKNCYAREKGGAVYTVDGNNRIVNCSFIKCHSDSTGALPSYGGAVYADGSTSVITCNFTNCSASNHKMAAWNRSIDCEDSDTNLKVINCSIDGVYYNGTAILNVGGSKNVLNTSGNYSRESVDGDICTYGNNRGIIL